MGQSQPSDTYPWTWEPTLAVALATALVPVMSLQLGRSLALFLSGAGWHWPPSSSLFTSAWAILKGEHLASLAGDLPDPGRAMWAITGLLCASTVAAAARLGSRHIAVRRHRGMATASEANQLLGLSRLRSHRAVIRPDLYKRGRR